MVTISAKGKKWKVRITYSKRWKIAWVGSLRPNVENIEAT